MGHADVQDSDCERFEDTTYKKLVDAFKDKEDSVVIARCNTSQENLDRLAIEVSLYPTIRLFPANEKDLPVDFNCGDLTYAAAYIKFVNQQAFNLKSPEEREKAWKSPKIQPKRRGTMSSQETISTRSSMSIGV